MAQDTILITEATRDGEPTEELPVEGELGLPVRYRPGPLLGEGGMGEVRLVEDRELGREVAMKIVRGVSPRALERFRLEAKTQAALQHPNIVPLYDWGQLSDGRIWYTMQVVRGQRFSELIEELFEPTSLPWGQTVSGWTLHRLILAMATVARAVSYAHSQGVLHRDLKPDNLMVGEFGEVYVLDWGVSRLQGEPSDLVEADAEPSNPSGSFTMDGTVIGTPAYMAPEQARGEVARHSPASDVYALGAVLFELLEGRPPGGLPIRNPEAPRELIQLSDRALAQAPEDRPSAAIFARTLDAWLDGSRRKAEAIEVLDLARRAALEPQQLRSEARALRRKAEALSEGIETYDPIDKKLPVWSLEEEAEGLASRASLLEGRWEGLIRRALNLDPELEGAHQDLADWYRGQLERAESRNDRGEAQRCEELVRLHDQGAHVAWLDGKGRVTLSTDPPGATIHVHRYVEQGRRLVPVRLETLQAPLAEHELDRGSYLFLIEAEGCHEVRYPVYLGRLEHWDAVPPGQTETQPVYLPRLGELAEDECYVPAGWCWLGDDPDSGAVEPAPRRWSWVDGFAVSRVHMTVGQYLRTLNAQPPAMAESLVPLVQTPGEDAQAPLFVRQDGSYRTEVVGSFHGADHSGDQVAPYATWEQASRIAALNARRLVTSEEWEKAARGVDGRQYPWGSAFDPVFANVIGHQPDPTPSAAGSLPEDVSPYGLLDCAGNRRSWCADYFRQTPAHDEDQRYVFVRGGSFHSPDTSHSRCASRFANRPERGYFVIGFRTGRSMGRP